MFGLWYKEFVKQIDCECGDALSAELLQHLDKVQQQPNGYFRI